VFAAAAFNMRKLMRGFALFAPFSASAVFAGLGVVRKPMSLYLVQGAVYGFAAAVQPGPFLAYLVSLTLSRGWRQALPAVLAPLLSDGPIIVLVLIVLSRVPPWWIQLLRFAGGFFILYLAAGALRSWRHPETVALADHPDRKGVFRAVLLNLLNPSPYVYWGLVGGPLLLSGWRETPVNGIGFLAGFYGTMVASMAGIILLCAYAGRRDERVNRFLSGVSGIALAGFGLYQIALGITNG
jgi:threonine/homoserine/homoserine lactone efflux protein